MFTLFDHDAHFSDASNCLNSFFSGLSARVFEQLCAFTSALSLVKKPSSYEYPVVTLSEVGFCARVLMRYFRRF